MSNTDLLGDAPEAAAVEADAAAKTNGTTRRRTGLSGMVLAELRELAGQLGITGTAGMRKGDLITAIKERQSGDGPGDGKAPAKARKSGAENGQLPFGEDGDAPKGRTNGRPAESAATTATTVATEAAAPAETTTNGASAPVTASAPAPAETAAPAETTAPAESAAPARTPAETTQPDKADQPADDRPEQGGDGEGGTRRRRRSGSGNRDGDNRGNDNRGGENRGDNRGGDNRENRADNNRDNRNDNRGDNNNRNNNRGDNNRGDNNRGDNNRGDNRGNNANTRVDDDEDGGGRRGRRFRDRRGRGRGSGRGEGGGQGGGGDTEIREDDVLLPVAGILDVLENYAFVRTSGYLAGPNDVYVSLSLVRRFGLRRGDAITGAVRQPREGEQQRQKFNPLVRVDTVNGVEPDQARKRPEFNKLTPLYPNERLRLETEQHKLTTRVIDLVMPVGKGQRALIVSPPKAGKTTIIQDLSNAIATNNPECYLMVVLVDERPEEVTDMQRSIKGEVIASTFDRPPGDHTSVAELSIERAKRLVEQGNDVVVMLDSITRLGRAYNNSSPASGRILSGGVDSTALYPPKRFLGAARNIENGGSLTIFATAMVETGSTGDTVIFEEFKGTGNAELKLDRKIAERRVFPAVDINPSSTRKDELLLSPDELAVNHKLRRVLVALDPHQAIDTLLHQLRKTRNNVEFLMQVSKTTPGMSDD